MKIRGLRWYVAALLCLVTALNYFDRQTLALLAVTLQRELGISTVQYSYITAAFLASYTVMYAVSGRLIDWMGARLGLSVFVGLWSGACALHALARTAREFILCRFLLGAAEPASFPAAVKVTTEWFPVRERALGVGIFNSGTAIGAGLAAPLVAWLTLHFGWRSAFVTGGALGLGWVAIWRLAYRGPRGHPLLAPEELRLIEERPAGAVAAPDRAWGSSARDLLRLPETWGCMLARMITDQISYFFAFWIPKFLEQDKGFSLADIGRYYWIPYCALAAGNLAGGAVPRWLVGRGWSLDRARKTVMGAASCLIPICFVGVTRAAGPAWAIALISGAMFGHAAWANITLPAEVFPSEVVGTVTGFGGALGSGLAAVTALVVGRTVADGSFTPVFLAYSLAPMAAFACVLLWVRDLGRIRHPRSAARRSRDAAP